MWLKWLPWRLLLSRLAKSRGFIDPVAVLSRLHRFAQPSEVTEPIELLRAGVILHARGLINARAIQHNLDWVWPFWVQRQFDPADTAFVPRAFSLTHINLTHRNWTAVGLPGVDWLPIVDPRGLVTPLFDGWSLDGWIIPDAGAPLLPSKAAEALQHLILDDRLAVKTEVAEHGHRLRSVVEVVQEDDKPCCLIRLEGASTSAGWLVAALRPFNPEGVSFIHKIRYESADASFIVNGHAQVRLDRSPDRVDMSHYRRGDVLDRLGVEPPARSVSCDVGMATAAAMFRLEPGAASRVVLRVPMLDAARPDALAAHRPRAVSTAPIPWARALEGSCELEVPDTRIQQLFDAAVRSLLLHAPGEVYPGPYTYRRFWFRDAAFILHALLNLNLIDPVERAIQRFPHRQTRLGYFRSQEGEWDSNGQVLWILDRYRCLSGRALSKPLVEALMKGAWWIKNKRLSDALEEPHAGLLPAGFSAEHLGPNDYYYWDDFWSVAGLRSAAAVLRDRNEQRLAQAFDREAELLLAAIDRSLERTASLRRHAGVPASPYRRMDAGAIGSLAVGYPLALWPANEPRLLDTAAFLMDHCRVHGGFFQDMIHSGINPYLTLHLAQVLLRAGDERYWDLVRTVAELASPTGQWPEAVHPHTLGGCMGDGQHIWAAAEWVMMIRHLFIREEGDRLIVGAGLPRAWLTGRQPLRFGPTPTPYGPVTIRIEPGPQQVRVHLDAAWRGQPPTIEVSLRGCRGLIAHDGPRCIELERLPADAQAQEAAP